MWIRCLGMLALCTLVAGCQLANNAAHNLTYEAKLATAEVQEHCNYEKLARDSWESVRKTEPGCMNSSEYAQGYKDGFVDYLQFGGSGEPPYVPPKRFWGPHYRTPEGHRSVEEWYAGFRHGAGAAQQSGYRQWVTLPSAHTTEPPHGTPAVTVEPGVQMPVPVEHQKPVSLRRLPAGELLPPSEPSKPIDLESAPAPQTSTRPLPALGEPVPPALASPTLPIDEPAKVGAAAKEVPPERQDAAPGLVIEVVKWTEDPAVPSAPAASGSTAPQGTPSAPISARLDTPVAETKPVLENPAAATFGRPSAAGKMVTD